MPRSILGRACLIFFFAMAAESAPNCMAPDAVWRVRSVGDPQISPDGKSILYVYSENDAMDDAGYSNLRHISIQGGTPDWRCFPSQER
jgi:hypothetical protein